MELDAILGAWTTPVSSRRCRSEVSLQAVLPDMLTQSRLGAIACPPEMLVAPPKGDHVLHLFHYEGDSLCNWRPGTQLLTDCCAQYTFVKNENSSYSVHFGPSDHGYSHWLGLTLPLGAYELSQFLFLLPAAAAGAKRDATPLRLISWLRFHLDPEVKGLIDSAMLHLSKCVHVCDQDLLDLGQQYLGMDDSVRSVVDLRDKLVDLVSILFASQTRGTLVLFVSAIHATDPLAQTRTLF